MFRQSKRLKPGKYRLRYELRFNAWQRKDKDGQRLIPGDSDWQETISTDITTITIRERQPEDTPPTATARLRFCRRRENRSQRDMSRCRCSRVGVCSWKPNSPRNHSKS